MKAILTLLLILFTQLSFSQTFKKGDKVQIEWKSKWYNGKVEEVKGDKYLISYDGYDASWNETVGKERLKEGSVTNTNTTTTTTTTNNTNSTTSSNLTKWSYIGIETIGDLAQSPDEKYVLAASAYSKLIILNAADLTLVSEIKITNYPLSTGTWSHDGVYLATGDGNGRTFIYKRGEDMSFSLYDSIPGYSMMTKVRFSPVNNDLLISAAPKEDYTDTQIDIWDVENKKLKKNVFKSTNADHSLSDISWSDDGSKIAVAVANKKKGILLFDSTGKSIAVISHTHDVSTVDFSPDGKFLASGGIDGKVSLWDLSTKKITWSTFWKKSSSDYIYGVAFAPDGLSVAACGMGYGAPVVIFNRSTGKVSKELGTTNSNGNALLFTSDSKYIYLANTTYGDVFKVPIVTKFKID